MNKDLINFSQITMNNKDGPQLYRTLPVEPISMGMAEEDEFNINSSQFSIPQYILNEQSFIALLGLKKSAEFPFTVLSGFGDYEIIVNGEISIDPELIGILPTYNGFSIALFDGSDASPATELSPFFFGDLGSFIIGTYYDMPHSPDLKLTMTREMDGVKSIRTKGGSDLVNRKYIKPAIWGDAGAWELYEDNPTNHDLSRSGRRSWDLSFSYLQDSDIFPDVSSLSNYETISPDGSIWEDGMNVTNNTLLTEDTFYSQVIHKTNGGQLPFVFQPDSSNNNIDGFAIAKFDSGFKFKQVSNGIFNISLKIREVW